MLETISPIENPEEFEGRELAFHSADIGGFQATQGNREITPEMEEETHEFKAPEKATSKEYRERIRNPEALRLIEENENAVEEMLNKLVLKIGDLGPTIKKLQEDKNITEEKARELGIKELSSKFYDIADKMCLGEKENLESARKMPSVLKNEERHKSAGASLFAIGLSDQLIDKYTGTREYFRQQLRDDERHFYQAGYEQEDLKYTRFRAYFETLRTSKNIFTNVTKDAQNAEKTFKDHFLKSPANKMLENPEAKSRNPEEESIYFASNSVAIGYNRRNPKNFICFSTLGADILSSGLSIEPAEPTLKDQKEHVSGIAVGDYQVNPRKGSAIPVEMFYPIVCESQYEQWKNFLVKNGYTDDWVNEHLITIPDNIFTEKTQKPENIFEKPRIVETPRDWDETQKEINRWVSTSLTEKLSKLSRNKDKVFATTKMRGSQGGVRGILYQWIDISKGAQNA